MRPPHASQSKKTEKNPHLVITQKQKPDFSRSKGMELLIAHEGEPFHRLEKHTTDVEARRDLLHRFMTPGAQKKIYHDKQTFFFSYTTSISELTHVNLFFLLPRVKSARLAHTKKKGTRHEPCQSFLHLRKCDSRVVGNEPENSWNIQWKTIEWKLIGERTQLQIDNITNLSHESFDSFFPAFVAFFRYRLPAYCIYPCTHISLLCTDGGTMGHTKQPSHLHLNFVHCLRLQTTPTFPDGNPRLTNPNVGNMTSECFNALTSSTLRGYQVNGALNRWRTHVLFGNNVLFYGFGSKKSLLNMLLDSLASEAFRTTCSGQTIHYKVIVLDKDNIIEHIEGFMDQLLNMSELLPSLQGKKQDIRDPQLHQTFEEIMKLLHRFHKRRKYQEDETNNFDPEMSGIFKDKKIKHYRRAIRSELKTNISYKAAPIFISHVFIKDSTTRLLFVVHSVDTLLLESEQGAIFFKFQHLLLCLLRSESVNLSLTDYLKMIRWILSVDFSITKALSILHEYSLFRYTLDLTNPYSKKDEIFLIPHVFHTPTFLFDPPKINEEHTMDENLELRSKNSKFDQKFEMNFPQKLFKEDGTTRIRVNSSQEKKLNDSTDIPLAKCFTSSQKYFLRIFLKIYLQECATRKNKYVGMQIIREKMIGYGFLYPDREFDFLRKELSSHDLLKFKEDNVAFFFPENLQRALEEP